MDNAIALVYSVVVVKLLEKYIGSADHVDYWKKKQSLTSVDYIRIPKKIYHKESLYLFHFPTNSPKPDNVVCD